MKKWKILLPSLLAISGMPLISLSGCVKGQTVDYKTVQFNTNGGSFISPIRVPAGKTIDKPTDPISIEGLKFKGWYDDEACSEGMEHDFVQPVVNDMTIYAKWSDPVIPTPNEIKLNKNNTEIEQGKSELLFATVLPQGTIQDTIWESNNTNVATVNETTGEVTAKAVGEATISVWPKDYKDTISPATCKVKVNPTLPLPTDIKVTPSALTLKEGGDSATLFTSITPETAIQDVTWSSNRTTVATVSDGKVNPLSRGTAIITATSVANPEVRATCNVTVEPSTPPPQDITLSQEALSIKVGDSAATLFATITPATASQAVDWDVDNEDVATIDVDQYGHAHVTAVARGNTTITATSELDDTVWATCAVTVTEQDPTIWQATFYKSYTDEEHYDVYTTELVQDGDLLTRPTDPDDPSLNFKGWYADPLCFDLFDWTLPISWDADLYAGWTNKNVYHVSLLNPAEDGLTINETAAVDSEDITLHIHSSNDNMDEISVWNVIVDDDTIYDYEFLTIDKNNAVLTIPGDEVTGDIQVGFKIGESR